MNSRLIAACVVAALALASASAAQDGRGGALSASLARAVRQCPQFTIFDDVEVRLDGSVVVLTGLVTTPAKKAAIERRVMRVEGVGEVRNDILILPPLSSDDELRRRVASAIYRNPSFWSYAAQSDPPIHIIVERGHVTLRGTVRSQAERTIARSLATGLGERSVVNELRMEGQ